MLKGKRADLGPMRFSALYMGSPVTGDSQLFPPDEWPFVSDLHTDDLQLIVTSWDCASKTGSQNDYNANVVIARTYSGRFIVLDVLKASGISPSCRKSSLPAIKRSRPSTAACPCWWSKDSSAGTQVLQIIEAEAPNLPKLAGKPAGKSKVVRAEAIRRTREEKLSIC